MLSISQGRLEMELATEFDAVVMLTWSDWKNEPRSNRYHYASRFARTLPVLFLQHRYLKRIGIYVEPSEIQGLDLINVSRELTEEDAQEIIHLLDARGVRRPLVWIYDSMNYQALIDLMPKAFKVYHATEDYLTETKGWNEGMKLVARSVAKLIPSIDFMVFVSQGIVNSYYKRGGYTGPSAVITNGCDAEYFIERSETYTLSESAARKPIAIFQGGINQRLDYELTLELIKRMQDWEFRFCGAATESPGWDQILEQPNVRYFGSVTLDEFTRHMCEATVGIITYIQDQWIRNSLPLKAYEYIACGLPVVTVPITALEGEPELIAVASTVAEFEAAMRRVSGTRHDEGILKIRRQVALANSYNIRFAIMTQRLLETKKVMLHSRKKLNVAMLYDSMFSMHVRTIREHLEAFEKFSHHSVTYISATPEFWNRASSEVLDMVNFSIFDAVFIHYSTRISVLNHFDEGLAQALEKYHGLKVLFIQDEYEGTEIARSWMDRLKFDVVYTCVPEDEVERVYPAYRFPATEFLPTLTGYVPEDAALERYSRPLAERKLLIAYRGRKLHAVYGDLGYEKYHIGVEMKAIAEQRNLAVDIEVDDSNRIYGTDWYEFLGSARATLGTESGSNVFDFDGSLRQQIKRLETENPSITFEEISKRVLAGHEGVVRMNQISPKIFEAIRLRTALVLFEGNYSGVVRPNEHYIPLKKDFSNINEVLSKLEDDAYLQQLTERAYRDIVTSGRFSYQSFVEGVDADIERRLLKSNSRKLLLGPLFFISRDGSLNQALPVLPFGLTVGPHQLGYPKSFEEMVQFSGDGFGWGITGFYIAAQRIFRWLLPISVKLKLKSANRWARQQFSLGNLKQVHIARKGWHLLPEPVRFRIVKLLRLS
jgi:glycosyltransferase involved in cell wall biosynthesis